MSNGQPGLFSSVLGFLSREVQDFVTTATGGSTAEKVVASTRSRRRLKQKREAQRLRKEYLNEGSTKHDRVEEEEWREQQHAFRSSDSPARPPRETSYSPTPSTSTQRGASRNPRRSLSPRRQKESSRTIPHPRRRHGTPPLRRSHTPPLDERASSDEHSDDTGAERTGQREEEVVEEEQEEPAPRQPLPIPRALRRRPSMTMPGALFPRSPSMDPEPSHPVARHVHFPTKPTYFDYEVPLPGPSSSPERPPLPTPMPRRSRAGSVGEVSGRRGLEAADGGGGGGSGAALPGPSWKEKGKQRATDPLENEGSSPPRSALAGRRRANAADVGFEPASAADTSGEIRVRGKERELSAVREERRAREQWWEAEAETTLIREEKAGYEDKIRMLEEEVKRLKGEVRVFNCFHSYSSY
ncbi:hypothetical protein BJV78DRAFT_1224191 [Lactifluus subvellereus]|nr:hypothetical protein BJV78DRAFT_1224191 [Lactifluus subvellereus]